VKIALAQLNYHIGNFRDNIQKVKAAIRQAKDAGAGLAVFAELAVTGYPPRDFLDYEDFIRQSEEAVAEIASETKEIAVIIGAPSRNNDTRGKALFNSAYFLADGKIRDIRHKSLLPTYDIFDEYRYFEPNRHFRLLEWKGVKIALTICEDLWMEGVHPLYTLNPMQELSRENPGLIINIAASPFHYSQAAMRRRVLRANVAHYKIPVIYVNHVGAQTELLFDGGSMAVDSDGGIALAMKYFEEDFGLVEWKDGRLLPGQDGDVTHRDPDVSHCKLIHDGLVTGIRDYFMKLGFRKAVLGLSGGIDSAVVLVLAARALGAENVLGVLMPSQFSSEHSVADAIALSENLGTAYRIIPINEGYDSMITSLKPVFGELPFDVTEENIQARLRAVILMALANKQGYILLNTSNKSEAAVGYGTLYGDMCGAISVLGDLYKTQVYELANHINSIEAVIPESIIRKPPSAELRPGQKDSDSLPDYAILDRILRMYIEEKQSESAIVKAGFPEELVKRVLKMVNTSEHKRYQSPPILRVSAKAFGSGRRMPIVGKYF